MQRSFARLLSLLVALLAGAGLAAPLHAQVGSVKAAQQISSADGGFTGSFDVHDHFGASATGLGDLDGDGIEDMAVGASGDDDGGDNRGAVYILFLNADGTVKQHQKISDTEGGFSAPLLNQDRFGTGVGAVGDFDGDGATELAVTSHPTGHNALWILFLNPNGTVKQHHLAYDDASGTDYGLNGALAGLGDLDGDGVDDLAAGSPYDADGEISAGAVRIFFLNADGSIKSVQKISNTQGGLGPILPRDTNFGNALDAFDDLDGDGTVDLVVGAFGWDEGGSYGIDSNVGAVYILFLNPDGTVKGYQQIANGHGGIVNEIGYDTAWFGRSVAALDDLDGNGHDDLAVFGYNEFGAAAVIPNAVWVLFLDATGTVQSYQKISDLQGSFDGDLSQNVNTFAWNIAALGDLNDDGVADLVATAEREHIGAIEEGAVWVLMLSDNAPPLADAREPQVVVTGTTVHLDASHSSDPDGDPLSFAWALGRPAASSAVYDDPTAVAPAFCADAEGVFTATVVVSDGEDTSQDALNVHVQTPETAFDLLEIAVAALSPGGVLAVLPMHEAKTLDRYRAKARKAFDQGRTDEAVARLKTFRAYVVRLRADGLLGAHHAGGLLDVADRLRVGLSTGCTVDAPALTADARPTATLQASAATPRAFALEGNYPNPFNPATEIGFALPEAAFVRLVVYDLLGREVARLVEGMQPAGRHTARFEAHDLPSGTYLYRLEAGRFSVTKTMVLMK